MPIRAHKKEPAAVELPNGVERRGTRIAALDRFLAEAFKKPRTTLAPHVELGSVMQLGGDTIIFRASAEAITTFFADKSHIGPGQSRSFTDGLPPGIVSVRLFEGWPHPQTNKPHYELEVTVVTPS